MTHRCTRRDFVAGAIAAGAGLALFPSGIAYAAQPVRRRETASSFFATASVESYSSHDTARNSGDLWPSCWADDGNLYAANGDGQGFSDDNAGAIVMNRVHGTPEQGITGERLAANEQIAPTWAGGSYHQKPTGMLAVDGNGDGRDELYVAVQDLTEPMVTSSTLQ